MLSLVAIAILSAVPGACSTPLPGSSKQDPLLARGSGVAVTASEFRARAEEAPPAVRAQLGAPGARRALLDKLALFQLAARAAEREGLRRKSNDAAGERRLVGEFLQRKFNDPKGAEQVTDAEARRYYDENLGEFVQPAKIRYWHLLVAAPEKGPGRAGKAAQARKLRARLAAADARDPNAFAHFAAQAVEDPAAGVSGGLLGLRSKEELVHEYSPRIADAVWRNGNVLSDVLPAPDGFHLFRADGGRPAENRTFEEAKASIKYRLYLGRMAAVRERWTREQLERARICVDEAALAAVPMSAVGPGQAAAGQPAAARKGGG